MNIYPSLMAADQSNLKKEIEVLAPYCAGFHIDVMDNVFVPNLLWNNAHEVNGIIKIAQSIWLHLMVENPAAFYEQLFLPIGSVVSFHIESNVDIFDFLKIIREKKHQVSIAIRPKTPISRIVPFLNIVDQVLLMSVEPGFSGQPFLESSFDRLFELVAYRNQHNAHFRIGVDGGVAQENINRLATQGADDCAIATAIFKTQDHVAALQKLQELASGR